MKKILTLLIMFATSANAQPQSLSDYLTSINGAEVKISGKIIFVESKFMFRSGDARFVVNIDSGRSDRKFIEDKCETSTWDFSYKCILTGFATIEIDGSDIELSIHTISNLKQID